jgi:hypothetical protein
MSDFQQGINTPADINKGPVQSSDSPAPKMDTDTEKDLKLAMELMSQGKAARADIDKDWSKRQDYYEGKQWQSEKFASLYKSKPVMNIIRQSIQSQLPILTDNRPGFSVLPREPGDFDFASMVGELVGTWWDNNSMDHTMVESLMDSMILDAAILKITWDPAKEDGVGDINVEVVNPFDVYVPYGAVDFGKQCPWVLHRTYKPIADLKEQFPEYADEIKDDSKAATGSKEVSTSDTEVKLVSPIDEYAPPGMAGTNTGDDQRKTAEVWEIWMSDSAIETINDKDGKEIKKKKYPRGCILTVLPNQKIVLQKVPNPYSHGKWPFVRIVDTLLPRKFWGEGEAKVLMQIQRMLNKALAHVFDNLNLMSNPVWIVEDDAGISPEQITNQISSVLLCRPGTNANAKIKRDFAPSMPPSMDAVLNLIFRMSEMSSGIGEVSQGRKPPGVNAAAAIESLQEAANTRIRLKERNLQVSLQQLGTQIVALMLQYYREPRVARITGKEGQWPQFFEFFVEEPEPGKYVMNQKRYAQQVNKDTGRPVYVPDLNYTQTPVTKGMMDVKVLSGTSMPWAKTSRANIAFKLFDSKAIDATELLKALEWPNADKIAEKMKSVSTQAPEGAVGGQI